MISRREALASAKRILDECDKPADKLVVAEAFLEMLNERREKMNTNEKILDGVRLRSGVYDDAMVVVYERALKRLRSVDPGHILLPELEKALGEARRENDRLKTLYGSATWEKEKK